VLATIYLIIKVIDFIGERTYFSALKKSRIPYPFYETMEAAEMLYTERERLYLFARTALIRHDLGLRRNSSSSLIVPSVVIHPAREAQHFTRTSAYLKISSKPSADGLLKPGKYTFAITPLYAPNYNLQLFALAFVIDD
jgi:hypothetical protein